MCLPNDPPPAGPDQSALDLALADDLAAGHRELRLERSAERGDGPGVIAAVLVDVVTVNDDVLVTEVLSDLTGQRDRTAVAQLAVSLG